MRVDLTEKTSTPASWRCEGPFTPDALRGRCKAVKCPPSTAVANVRRVDSTTATLATEPGALLVVGVGIEWASQTTGAARSAIERADRVLFAVTNPLAARWIRSLNANADALAYPRDGRPRQQIYDAMVETILTDLRKGGRLCVAFYGHPGVLVAAGHQAIRRARVEGHTAWMLPAVSALDCLFADLGIDPGERGLQIDEASVFLRRRSTVDPRLPLVLHQIALVDNHGPYDPRQASAIGRGLERLRAKLAKAFPPDHELIIYEAATDPLRAPRIEAIELAELAAAAVSEISTLYVPAFPGRVADHNHKGEDHASAQDFGTRSEP